MAHCIFVFPILLLLLPFVIAPTTQPNDDKNDALLSVAIVAPMEICRQVPAAGKEKGKEDCQLVNVFYDDGSSFSLVSLSRLCAWLLGPRSASLADRERVQFSLKPFRAEATDAVEVKAMCSSELDGEQTNFLKRRFSWGRWVFQLFAPEFVGWEEQRPWVAIGQSYIHKIGVKRVGAEQGGVGVFEMLSSSDVRAYAGRFHYLRSVSVENFPLVGRKDEIGLAIYSMVAEDNYSVVTNGKDGRGDYAKLTPGAEVKLEDYYHVAVADGGAVDDQQKQSEANNNKEKEELAKQDLSVYLKNKDRLGFLFGSKWRNEVLELTDLTDESAKGLHPTVLHEFIYLTVCRPLLGGEQPHCIRKVPAIMDKGNGASKMRFKLAQRLGLLDGGKNSDGESAATVPLKVHGVGGYSETKLWYDNVKAVVGGNHLLKFQVPDAERPLNPLQGVDVQEAFPGILVPNKAVYDALTTSGGGGSDEVWSQLHFHELEPAIIIGVGIAAKLEKVVEKDVPTLGFKAKHYEELSAPWSGYEDAMGISGPGYVPEVSTKEYRKALEGHLKDD